MKTIAEIDYELRAKARQASRLPDTHISKVHAEIDDLLTEREFVLGLAEVPC